MSFMGRVRALVAGLAIAATTQVALAEKRVALVIGNSVYENTGRLVNPLNDATDLGTALERLDFQVIKGNDLDKRGMDRLIAQFARAATDADVALFFYAGHGMQFNGSNYLMPVDARLEDDVSLSFEMTKVDDVLSAISRARGVKLIILDACRNNPLAERLQTRASNRSIGPTRGFTRIERTQGTLVAFATQANDVAIDGDGRNSPFTTALLREIETPNLEVGTLFRRVTAEVNKVTGGKQTPELSVSILGEFYFRRTESDLLVWNTLKDSPNKSDFTDFLARFPTSALADAARARIAALDKADADRLARDAAERERAARLKAQQDQAEKLRLEQERIRLALARDLAEQQRLAREQAERAKLEHERLMKELADREAQMREQLARLTNPDAPPPPVTPDPAPGQRQIVVQPVTPAPIPPPPPVQPAPTPPPLVVPPLVTTQPAQPVQLFSPPPVQPQPVQPAPVQPPPVQPLPPLPPIAALPERPILVVPPTPVAPPQMPRPDLIRAVKTELNRLGCFTGSIDPSWPTPAATRGLADYQRHAEKPPVDLSIQLLDNLKSHRERVCPLVCDRGQQAIGGVCVAVAPPPAVKPQRPAVAPPPPKPRPVAQPRPKPAPRVVSRPKPTGGGGRCFNFNGQRFCE